MAAVKPSDSKGSAYAGPARRGLLALSFGALGVIYGDIGTSPLYAYQSVFTAPPSREETLSAASLFFWTLTLIVLVKYVGIILRFDDNGEGGTFALYSLICRAAGFGPYGPSQPVDMHFLTGGAGALASRLPRGATRGHWWSLQTGLGGRVRAWYRRSQAGQVALLVVVMLATAMVIGDGVLTPSISVLSAISGLKVATDQITQSTVVGISIAVLVLLFAVQRAGTGKISVVFAPVVTVWLLFNASLGFYNLSTNGWGIWEAINPAYIFTAFTGPGGFDAGWRLLAGVMLCITGAEAMYADLGHFNAAAVMLSFSGFVYPCLVVTYMGQAAYIIGHPDAYEDPFWNSVPHGAFWPMLVVATLTSVVASQALISGVMSIMRQAMMLGVFPRLRVEHTDELQEGQIYIGQINFMLLIGCVAMVAGFQDTTAMGHAYGVAVMTVMFVTTFLSALVMVACYDINPILVGLYLAFFVPLEGLFLSSNAIKIPEGGWVTLVIAVFVASINFVWWYGSRQKTKWLLEQAAANTSLLRQLPAVDDADDVTSGRGAPPPAARPDGDGGAGFIGTYSAGDRDLTSKSNVEVLREGNKHAQEAGDGGARGAGTGRLSAVSAPYRRGGAASGGESKLERAQMSFGDMPLARVPGLAIFYTQSTSGVPAVMGHLLNNLPALARVSVLLTLRFVPMPYVMPTERFLVRRSRTIAGVYRVIARYGYMEEIDHGAHFVRQLVGCLVRHAAGEGREVVPRGGSPLAGSARGRSSGSDGGGHVALDVGEGAAPTAAAGGEGRGDGRAAKAWFSMSASMDDDATLMAVPAQAGEPPADGAEHVASIIAPLASPNTAAAEPPIAHAEIIPELGGSPRQLGRESYTRWQYREQSLPHRRRGGQPTLGGGPESFGVSTSGGGAGPPLSVPSIMARAASAGAPGIAPGGLSRRQLDEVGVLLDCYRQRTVYVVGGTRVLGREAGWNLLRRGVVQAYGAIANNTQPATRAWQLPDGQVVEVTLTMRL